VLQSYWDELASGEAIGMVTLLATDFPVVREVKTTSWAPKPQ